uniref:Uncharacterized protein n=1 Tax=Aegilops tauschii TaxID=37682 RepID=N1QYK8_AEGTA
MAARTQAWQFAAALVFFHGSEYVLAAAFHGHSNVTATYLCGILGIQAFFYGQLERRICTESALGVTIYKLSVSNLQSNAYPLLSSSLICLRKALYNMDSRDAKRASYVMDFTQYNTNLEFDEAEESFLSSSIWREC